METEKLYYQDPYLTAFTARVLSCEKSKSGWAVVLDRTSFYPEGGGQPADHGTLGAVQVTDVHETKGVIFHTCDGPVEIGTQVAPPVRPHAAALRGAHSLRPAVLAVPL